MKKNIQELFNIPGKLQLEVRSEDHPMLQRIDPFYVFRKSTLTDVLMWMMGAAGNDPLYLTGHTGAGKSSVVTQIAARLRIPLYVVSCHDRMEVPELFGRFVVKDGSMQWVDGPLIQGLKDPAGAWILLDEVDSLEPGTMIGLNAVLEGRSVIIPETGEIIDPLANGAKIIAAGNTAGNGDQTGLYLSTKRQNLASMGRFLVAKVDYPEPEVEQSLLTDIAPTIPEKIRAAMLRMVHEARDLFKEGHLDVAFCPRSLQRWATVSVFKSAIAEPGTDPMVDAMDLAIGNRAEPESCQALHELWQRIKEEEAVI
ncbi:AAA family ATPase [Geoalkalibacter halelectricus]|uniref:AAA family ATPase n=1 Tax=Geoalkalibacter halelectricus TaxID=2847045 RepID=UPI00266EDFA4|nr:AAA family ATPase [Geoalkalibacter halelectricus]MDO3380412.1 AAA family ATPase [Geoalkalibacter halelectricus]